MPLFIRWSAPRAPKANLDMKSTPIPVWCQLCLRNLRSTRQAGSKVLVVILTFFWILNFEFCPAFTHSTCSNAHASSISCTILWKCVFKRIQRCKNCWPINFQIINSFPWLGTQTHWWLRHLPIRPLNCLWSVCFHGQLRPSIYTEPWWPSSEILLQESVLASDSPALLSDQVEIILTKIFDVSIPSYVSLTPLKYANPSLPLLHHHIHNATQSLHFLLHHQSQRPRIQTTPHIDWPCHPSSQDLGESSGILDAGWGVERSA